MEIKKLNNPPAFPSEYSGAEYDFTGQPVISERKYYGMTLLDYFAAKAMQSMVNISSTNDGFEVELSRRAYIVATAMLNERGKYLNTDK